MQLKAYKSCRSNEGWQAVRIPSDTDDKITYTVLVSPWKPEESICDCPGFLFHYGRCKHQKRAWDQVCRWTELDLKGPDQIRSGLGQDDDYCPSCGGPVKYEVEVVDESE